MRLTVPLTVKHVVLGCLGVGALASAGCAESGVPTNPSSSLTSSAASTAFPRSGHFYITKNCDHYQGVAGQFCTITSSTLAEIEVDTRIIYVSDLNYPVLDTDIILDPPGPGNNKAFGRCTLSLLTNRGECALTGGTGKFSHLWLSAKVTKLGKSGEGNDWAWEGTYTFKPRD